METEPPSNPQDLTAFVTDLLEQMCAPASGSQHAADETRKRTQADALREHVEPDRRAH